MGGRDAQAPPFCAPSPGDAEPELGEDMSREVLRGGEPGEVYRGGNQRWGALFLSLPPRTPAVLLRNRHASS